VTISLRTANEIPGFGGTEWDPAGYKIEREAERVAAKDKHVQGQCALCPWTTSGPAEAVITRQVAHREETHDVVLKWRAGRKGQPRLTPAQSKALRHLMRNAVREDMAVRELA
jgi:hypothetical protein